MYDLQCTYVYSTHTYSVKVRIIKKNVWSRINNDTSMRKKMLKFLLNLNLSVYINNIKWFQTNWLETLKFPGMISWIVSIWQTVQLSQFIFSLFFLISKSHDVILEGKKWMKLKWTILFVDRYILNFERILSHFWALCSFSTPTKIMWNKMDKISLLSSAYLIQFSLCYSTSKGRMIALYIQLSLHFSFQQCDSVKKGTIDEKIIKKL